MARPHIAGYLRHIVLKLLSSPEIKFVGQQLRISNHLDMICDNLWAINAVIFDANLHAEIQPKLMKWVKDVNTAIVDVQNILEVIQDFYQQPNEQKQEVTTSPSLLVQASSIRTKTCFISSSRHTILVDLKQIAQSLNCLLSRTVAFGLHIDMIDSMDPNQAKYLSILQQVVVGRDDDMNKILEIIFRLEKGQSSAYISDNEPSVVAITGQPKVGKSILARMVYHHPLVCEVFKHRIWVDDLNYKFALSNYKQIARECARHLTGMISSNVDISDLTRQSLAQTKFLLILDGFGTIEEENKDKLKELMKYLFCLGAPGSRVIITCYSYPIVRNDPIVYSEKIYKTKDVSEDGWTKIFLRYATPTQQYDQAKQDFSSTRMTDLQNLANEEYNNLYDPKPGEAIGRGLLSRHTIFCKYPDVYYDLIRKHYISHELTQLNFYSKLMQSLPLSFAKGCFDMLVAEGIFNYSRDSQQKIQREIRRYAINEPSKDFYHLGNKNIINNFSKMDVQEFRIPECRYLCICINFDTSTILNNLPVRVASNLRMLLLYKVKKDMHLQFQKYHEASSIEIPKSLVKNLIILSIINTGIQQLPKRLSMLLRLRYLNISEEMEELPESICDLYNLRILGLSHCKKLLMLPEKIHKLVKLQILHLSYCTRLQKLPNSISNLVNLQVLDIEACHWLKELPEDLRYLKRLRSLNMIGCASLTQIPLGVSELTDLQHLSGYIVDDYDNRRLSLKELESLTNIEQLHIRHLEYELSLNDITSVNLKDKKHLENLVLHWEWWNMDVRTHDQIQSLTVLDSFQPNVTHLKSLEIISYLGMQFPNWMMMDKEFLLFKFLVEIRLINLKRCENLPSLGILPSLRIFEVSGLDSLTYASKKISDDEVEFSGLKELTLSEMPNLVEWNIRCPFLQQLTLIHCPKLIRLFGFLLGNKLIIWLQSKMLGPYCIWFQSKFRHIEELEIVGCHELRWLPGAIKNCNRLRGLSIIRCAKVLSLPNWLQKMSRLWKVFISGCTSISHVPEGLKQKLKDRIIIEGCPKLQALTK